MNEGGFAGRIVTILLLVVLIVLAFLVLLSLNHQQRQIVSLVEEMKRLRQTIGAGAPVGPGPGAVDGERWGPDGKDAIGRPRAPAPGFELYPPPGAPEIPGRTIPRTPEFIPELCGMYVNGEVSEPDKINYYLTNDGLATRIDREVHERLFTINPDDPTELWPELAVAWETSDDKLTYRFHLRKGVTFSDGSPFGADDVLFTYNALMDPDVESEHIKASFELVESVRTIDPYTVEVRMRERYWKALKQFGYNLRVFPREYFEAEIPRRAAEQGIRPFSTAPGEPGFAKVFNTFTRVMPPGTAPYMWHDGESWVTNQHITLYPYLKAWRRQLNPDHYRIERLRWLIVRDDVARHEEFRGQNVDVLVVDHNAWEDQLSKDPSITNIANHYVYDHIGLLYSFLSFNCRRAPFDDVNARRAVAHLMDRETILRELSRGHGRIATCPTKPIYPEYSHDIKPRRYDPELARRILEDAGWKDSDGDGLLDKGGRILEFSFSVPAGRTFFTTVTTMLQEACRSIGVRCKADPKEWSLFIKDYYELNFDLVCLYHSASDPWIDLYESFHSSQTGPRAGNDSGWINKEVDDLLEKIRREFDDKARAALFHRFNHIFHDEAPKLLLIHGEVGVLLNKRIRGATIRPTGLQNFDLWIDPKDVRR